MSLPFLPVMCAAQSSFGLSGSRSSSSASMVSPCILLLVFHLLAVHVMTVASHHPRLHHRMHAYPPHQQPQTPPLTQDNTGERRQESIFLKSLLRSSQSGNPQDADDADDRMVELKSALTEEELLTMRSSFFLNTLMDKLHMPSRRPNVTIDMSLLPEPVQRELALQKEQMQQDEQMQGDEPVWDDDEADEQQHPHDTQAKTQQIFIIGKPSDDCPVKAYSGCFVLEWSGDMSALSKAKLMLHVRGDSSGPPHKLTMYKLLRGNETHKHSMTLSSSSADEKHWLSVDMKDTLRDWEPRHHNHHAHQRQHHRHLIQIVCDACEQRDSPVSLQGQGAPFLNIKFSHASSSPSPSVGHHSMKPRGRGRRTKRSLQGYCKLHRLSIDLTRDFGHDYDFINQPRTFDKFNYCDGSCSFHVDRTKLFDRLRDRLLHDYHTQKRMLHMCCVPTHLAPLTIIYLDENGNIRHEVVPDMLAQHCSCK